MKNNKPYEKLALIYDQLMNHVDYEMWSLYVINLMDKFDTNIHSVADLACGTGNFLPFLKKRYPHIYGCDLSEAMVRQATKKRELRSVPIFISDVCSISLHDNCVNAALLLYDSLNYLLDLSALNKAISEVKRILKPSGLFIFDVVSEKHCKKYYADFHENEFWHRTGYSRHSYFDEGKGYQYNDFRIILDGFTYSERHVQKIYATSILIDTLQSHSLEIIDILEEFSFEKAKDTTERMHFLCQKS
jgi:ubiquinone/menaquinone biosynthesis C-methylase UbiE